MSGLSDLARRLNSLGSVVPNAVAKGVEFAEKQVKKAGKEGGALRGGNAAVATVSATGDAISITRIGSKDGSFAYGIRPDFLALWVANAALREAAERIRGDK